MSDEALAGKILGRIVALRAELERYIVVANQQVAAYQAIIAELERIVSEEVPVPAEGEAGE